MFFAVPGDLSTPTGGYEYARQLLRRLPGLRCLPLPGGFPFPDQAGLTETAARLTTVPADTALLIDGLALGALPEWVLDQIRAPIVALVHHPLCQETGLSDAARDALRLSERAALARAVRVVTTSRNTAALLQTTFAVPDARITIAEPGTAPAPQAPRIGDPPHLLSVGAVVPRKGYEVLVRALSGLTDLPWRLTIAGALDRHAATATTLRTLCAALPGRISLIGAVPDAGLSALYAEADIYVSAALYEGYGMAVATAMAHGLPIVAATGGALAETIPPGASCPCLPGDPASLRGALRQMLRDRTMQDDCAAASRIAGQHLPDWAQTASRVWNAVCTPNRAHQP
jgi:glycosyltransferase involved in cell wall biosynthesis